MRVPEGWSYEDRGDDAILQRPNFGFTTIDFVARGFRTGITTFGRLSSTKIYKGRGWRAALVRDAIAWLGAL